MKKTLSYLSIGILFGIIMYKSEAASWFRIYEMFRFQSFHMYGIIGSALVLGILQVWLIKKRKIKSINGKLIQIDPKEKGIIRYLVGGVIFGLGWALVGACPGPMFTLLGAGFSGILLVLIGAILGTYIYGIIKENLPH